MVESDDGNNIYPMNVLDLGSLPIQFQPYDQKMLLALDALKGNQVRLAGGRIFGRAVVNSDWIQSMEGVLQR